MNVREQIIEKLSAALVALGVNSPQITLDLNADLSHGDYASSVSLVYAKQLGTAPRALAEKIVTALESIDGIKAEVAGPGFINFKMSFPTVLNQIKDAAVDEKWGSNATQAKKEILIEYTSPNLFKPLHIGNLVGNVIGESISRLMEFSGATVRRINYPSDIGLTVAKGVWGLKKLNGDPTNISQLGDAYRAGNEAYENDAAAKLEIDGVNQALYEGSDTELNALRERGVATSQSHLDALCKKLGTTFDFELYESQAAALGKEVVQSNIDVFPESDGARIFNGSHTRVFLNSKGLPTYEAKDLGNFLLKQRRFPNWDTYLVVTGMEQKEYFKVLYEAIRRLFPESARKSLVHIATGFLTLTTGKMSSRLGNVLTGESLFCELSDAAKERAAESRTDDVEKLAEQIGVAALKYEILKQGTGKNIVFDKEKALSLQGSSGPYLQYAYARTLSLLEKVRGAEEVETMKVEYDQDFQEVGGVYAVSHKLIAFPEIVERASTEMEPHLVTTYLIDLASAFSSWYGTERIIVDGKILKDRPIIIDAVRQTLKNGLWLLGIPAPEKM